MNGWELHKSLNIGGRDYPIRWDFRAILDILGAYSDPELDAGEETEIMLRILFPDFEDIPPAYINEAIQKGCAFIDCGQKHDGRPRPRLIDWVQDAVLIIPAVNKVYGGRDIRTEPELHWWTFWGYYMSIGESLLSSVIHIRQKKSKRKKLEKWEEEFYRENRSLIDLEKPKTEEDKAIQEYFNKWL